MKKFTFKKQTSDVWSLNEFEEIKYDKRECGMIISYNSPKRTIARFSVQKDGKEFTDDNSNCSWMWVELDHKTKSADEMRQYLKDNTEEIRNKFNLHFFEN